MNTRAHFEEDAAGDIVPCTPSPDKNNTIRSIAVSLLSSSYIII